MTRRRIQNGLNQSIARIESLSECGCLRDIFRVHGTFLNVRVGDLEPVVIRLIIMRVILANGANDLLIVTKFSFLEAHRTTVELARAKNCSLRANVCVCRKAEYVRVFKVGAI